MWCFHHGDGGCKECLALREREVKALEQISADLKLGITALQTIANYLTKPQSGIPVKLNVKFGPGVAKQT
jgi:hypothetical protein